MSYPMWDLNINLTEFKRVLKHPQDRRFPGFFARVLSRTPFYEVFQKYISVPIFIKYFSRAKNLMQIDPLGVGKIAFWEWLYKKLKEDLR